MWCFILLYLILSFYFVFYFILCFYFVLLPWVGRGGRCFIMFCLRLGLVRLLLVLFCFVFVEFEFNLDFIWCFYYFAIGFVFY